MRASGSHSVTLRRRRAARRRPARRLPDRRARCRTWSATSPSGLFHASASLGIAEAAFAARRRPDRIGDDARAPMLVAESAIDLAAARGAIARAAALIDDHYAAHPPTTAPTTRSSRSSPRARRRRRSSTRPRRGSSTARSRSRAAPATSTARRSRAPTATCAPGRSCTRSAPTAPTASSPDGARSAPAARVAMRSCALLATPSAGRASCSSPVCSRRRRVSSCCPRSFPSSRASSASRRPRPVSCARCPARPAASPRSCWRSRRADRAAHAAQHRRGAGDRRLRAERGGALLYGPGRRAGCHRRRGRRVGRGRDRRRWRLEHAFRAPADARLGRSPGCRRPGSSACRSPGPPRRSTGVSHGSPCPRHRPWSRSARATCPAGSAHRQRCGAAAWRRPDVARFTAGELLANAAWAGVLTYSGSLLIESYSASRGLVSAGLGIAAAAMVPGTFVGRRACRRPPLLCSVP